MNLTEKQKQWIAWVAVALVMALISTLFGVNYPIPEPPTFQSPLDDQVIVMGTTHFTNISAEDVTATDDLSVTDDATIGGDMTVSGTASWGCSTSTITNNLALTGTLEVTGTTACNSTLDVDGATTLNSALDVDGNITSGTGAITITDSLNVTDTVDFDSTLNVDGAATLVSTLSVGGDVTLENGGTIGEATDTVVDLSEFLAFTEQTAVSLTAQLTITPTGTYQPLTSASAVSTSLTTAIADGVVNGQILILVNENAADAITVVDGANTKMGGDKVLTGGEGDCIFLIWDGADWLAFGYNDN